MNNDRLAKILLFPLPLALAWQAAPSSVICVLFWLAVIRIDCQLWHGRDSRWERAALLVFFAGQAMNAVVTVVNGGYMPVIGGDGPFLSMWVQASESHRLLWLADTYHMPWWGGASLGDTFIAAGLLGLTAAWAVQSAARLRRQIAGALTRDRTRDAALDARGARLSAVLRRPVRRVLPQ